MKVYDASQKQNCLICGFEVNQNKQGKFTSHLLKTHQLSLNEYLKQYFYSKKQITCQYELCQNEVSFRRGIPNRFCSRSCRGKREPLRCSICSSIFEANNRKTKTCSLECAQQLRSKNAKRWHESLTDEYKKEHFEKIIEKTAATRRINHTPSWNSGKTGIYSDETLEKIRAATLRQLQSEVFKKTSIEKKMENFLIKANIAYKYSLIVNKVQFDFYLVEANIVIECDGDFWHANPKFYPDEEKLYATQKRIKEKDQVKNKIAEDLGMTLLRFWEDDINHNFDFVEASIINALSATT